MLEAFVSFLFYCSKIFKCWAVVKVATKIILCSGIQSATNIIFKRKIYYEVGNSFLQYIKPYRAGTYNFVLYIQKIIG